MQNYRRGEVALTINGVEFKIFFGTNELCVLEEVLDKPLHEILRDAENYMTRLSFLRAALYAGTRHDRRLSKMTLDKAGSLIDPAKNMTEIAEAITKALTASLNGGKLPSDAEIKAAAEEKAEEPADPLAELIGTSTE